VGFFDFLFGKKKDKKAPAGAKKPAVAKVAAKKPVQKAEKLPRVDIEKRFGLLNRTGQGSMSKVWRAQDRTLGRVVCLKILDKEKTAKFEARFVGLNKPKEGAICMALRHKNIVQTFEYGMTTTGEMFLVMEYVEGLGLNFLVETRSPDLNGKRVDILRQLSDGLEYLHNTGYLHRDICPRNVMVTADGTVKLIDFGLTIPNTPDFLRPGNRTGTTEYLAPELIRRQQTDLRVDLFALGVTAYQVFTSGLPWDKASSMETLIAKMRNPGRDPRDHRRDLDLETVNFLKKGIEREARDRFQTVAQFREALLRLPGHY
jgi:serine/threonine protein kinase